MRFQSLLSWFALPVYVWQGLAVRRRSLRMAPPQSNGLIETSGKGRKITILLLGDSSAAGVGVRTIEESLGGQLPPLLRKLTGRPVTLHVSGHNSATSSQIRDHVVPYLPPVEFDYICLNIGTNDAKNFHRGNRFCRDFGTLLYSLRAKYPAAKIIWSGILDLEGVPALPTPLNMILGIRSRILNRNGRILCYERGALAPDSEWEVTPENFAVDGFHASEKGYHEWAKGLAKYIADLDR